MRGPGANHRRQRPTRAAIAITLARDRAKAGEDLAYAIINDGATAVLTGVDYSFECRRATGWRPVGRGAWFTAVGLIIDPGQRRELTATIPTGMAAGAYRLVKTVKVAQAAGNDAANHWGAAPAVTLTVQFLVVD